MNEETPNEAPVDRGAARYGSAEPAKPVEKPVTLTGQATQAKAGSRPQEQASDAEDPADRGEARFGKPEEEAEPEPVHGAPDRGYALQPPEGLELTGEIVKEISPVLKELNLSNAGAQKLMPLAKSFHDRIIKGQYEAHVEASKEWAREVRADKDLGGRNFAETQRLIDVTMAAAGNDPELHALMVDSKLGNHPALVRAFRNIGRKLSRSR